MDFLQAGTTSKGISLDLIHARRYIDALEPRAAIESALADFGHRGRNDYGPWCINAVKIDLLGTVNGVRVRAVELYTEPCLGIGNIQTPDLAIVESAIANRMQKTGIDGQMVKGNARKGIGLNRVHAFGQGNVIKALSGAVKVMRIHQGVCTQISKGDATPAIQILDVDLGQVVTTVKGIVPYLDDT